MGLLIYLFSLAIDIYIIIIVAQIAISWLTIFGVINLDNRQAQQLVALLQRATDPVYKPLRKVIPPIGGIDITPIIVILGLNLLRSVVIGALLSI